MSALRPAAFRRGVAALFLAALLVRGLHVAEIGASPVARLLVGDARSYDAWARDIAAGHWVGTSTFYQAPLYPYALAALYAVARPDPMTVRWTQAVVGALACALLALAGRSWFGPRAGLCAGAILAVYPAAVFFDGLVQKAALDNVLMCALLALLGAYVASSRLALLFAAGAALGALALTRENALVFAALLVPWLPWHLRNEGWSVRLRAVAALLAGAALLLVPVGLRNRAVGGTFLITTSQAGSNFYIGNHEGATGRYVPLRPGREMPEFERKDATDLAEQAAGRPLTPAEVSSYWWGRSLAWMGAHPGAWVALVAKKGLMTWNRVELPDTESLSVYRDLSTTLRVLALALGFGVLAPIGVGGLVLAWIRLPRSRILAVMLVGFSAAVALFYVFARYRFPMAPMLCLFAGYALVEAWDALRAHDAASLRPALVTAVLAAVVVNLPIVSTAGEHAGAYANLGIGLAEAGRLEEAVPFYRKAIELAPSDATAHANLGIALSGLGRIEEAGTEIVTALRLEPHLGAAHRAMALLLARRGNFADAETHFREALRADPASSVNGTDLANCVFEQGRTAEAVGLYREVLARDPDYLDARLNLVQGLVALGRRDEARGEAEEALRRAPANADARRAVDALQNR